MKERGADMKLTKTEKIWITVVAIFYILYNIPGIPPHGEAIPTFIHAALTVLPCGSPSISVCPGSTRSTN